MGWAHHVTHCLGFNTTGHTARCTRSLDLIFVTFCEVPDRVVWMAENPKVISADVGEFLKIRLVYPGPVQTVDELVRGHGDFRSLSGPWSRGKEQRTEESEHTPVRMREGDEIAEGRSCEDVLIVPELSSALVLVEAW
jgi:hypothetical protein